MDYQEIANQLDEELNMNIEFCDWENEPVILASNPSLHLNKRYNENNVAIVPVATYSTYKTIKAELLSHHWICVLS